MTTVIWDATVVLWTMLSLGSRATEVSKVKMTTHTREEIWPVLRTNLNYRFRLLTSLTLLRETKMLWNRLLLNRDQSLLLSMLVHCSSTLEVLLTQLCALTNWTTVFWLLVMELKRKTTGSLRTLGDLHGEKKDSSESLEERTNVVWLMPPLTLMLNEQFNNKPLIFINIHIVE